MAADASTVELLILLDQSDDMRALGPKRARSLASIASRVVSDVGRGSALPVEVGVTGLGAGGPTIGAVARRELRGQNNPGELLPLAAGQLPSLPQWTSIFRQSFDQHRRAPVVVLVTASNSNLRASLLNYESAIGADSLPALYSVALPTRADRAKVGEPLIVERRTPPWVDALGIQEPDLGSETARALERFLRYAVDLASQAPPLPALRPQGQLQLSADTDGTEGPIQNGKLPWAGIAVGTALLVITLVLLLTVWALA